MFGLFIGEGDEIFDRKCNLKNKRPFTLSGKEVRVRYLTTKLFNIRYKKLMQIGGASQWYWQNAIYFLLKWASWWCCEWRGIICKCLNCCFDKPQFSHMKVEVTIVCSGAESQLCEWLASSSWTRLLPSLCLRLLICKTEKSQPTSEGGKVYRY